MPVNEIHIRPTLVTQNHTNMYLLLNYPINYTLKKLGPWKFTYLDFFVSSGSCSVVSSINAATTYPISTILATSAETPPLIMALLLNKY